MFLGPARENRSVVFDSEKHSVSHLASGRFARSELDLRELELLKSVPALRITRESAASAHHRQTSWSVNKTRDTTTLFSLNTERENILSKISAIMYSVMACSEV